ncbi:MAG: HAD-IIB family hydrolase [Patescibacteria group bacterium]|nr:HAD-IIB family hydrolase [Patescibacteria group bacterium]
MSEVIYTDRTHAENQALELLPLLSEHTLLAIDMNQRELADYFKNVTAIFSDVDGTLVELGKNDISSAYSDLFHTLYEKNVSMTLVTGKPHSEILLLLAALPKHTPLRIVYEKGAYLLDIDEEGEATKQYLLSSPEIEKYVRQLKDELTAEIDSLQQRYLASDGTPRVTIGLGGDDSHESLVSIDLLAGTPPANYIDTTGKARENLKLKDVGLQIQITADLKAFLMDRHPTWSFVDLGNGNIEIAPAEIEKDKAIKAMPDFATAKGVLILGDSNNDSKMFALRSQPNVKAGLILHSKKLAWLTDDVDFVSFGMANAIPLIESVLNP